ncbi:MAG: TetR/AcrR family transcriptional regulator [Succinivibrionaceae bacterium]
MSEQTAVPEKSRHLCREERTKLLLQSARKIFVEQGYSRGNLDDIIALSGGSRRIIYQQFGGKQGLFQAVINDFYQEILQPVNITCFTGENLRETIKVWFKGFVKILRQESYFRFLQLILRESINNPGLFARYILPHIEQARLILIDAITKCQEQGTICNTLPAWEIVDMGAALIRGEFLLKTVLFEQLDVSDNLERFIDNLMMLLSPKKDR